MRCTRQTVFRHRHYKHHKNVTLQPLSKMAAVLLCVILASAALSGCGSSDKSYSAYQKQNGYFLLSASSGQVKADSFASGLCVASKDETYDLSVDLKDTAAAGLFSLDDKKTLYGNNLFEKEYPASMTKIMTAVVALENMDPETQITATDDVENLDGDAQKIGIEEGDTMTLDQALNYMLVYSANDAAVMIADAVGGSQEKFADMMNQEAQSLGCTGTHFVNPDGLHDDNHYTTAYDMYLMLNRAFQSDEFSAIAKKSAYTTTFKDKDGNDKSVDVTSTDYYLNGNVSVPDGVTVLGGKTGTTDAAGHCLIIESQNTEGSHFISIVMNAKDEDTLYSVMSSLLSHI